MSISLDGLNELSDEEFARYFSDIAEHSPWVMERVAEQRPFVSLRGIHAAVLDVLCEASKREQMDLISVHPDLAGKAARAGDMTEASKEEQSGAGLDRLEDEEFEKFQKLNSAYRSKFGFPFILAVKGHDKASILKSFESRLEHDGDEEASEALRQIGEIMRYRLEDMLETEDN